MDEHRLHYGGAWTASVIEDVTYIYFEEYIADFELCMAFVLDNKAGFYFSLWNGLVMDDNTTIAFYSPITPVVPGTL